MVCQALGNNSAYSHSNMDWLEAGSFRCFSMPGKLLVWELVDRWEDVYLYKFVASYDSTIKTHQPLTDDMEHRIMDLVKDTFRPGIPMNEKNYQAYLKKIQQRAEELGLSQSLTVKKFSEYYHSYETELPVVTESALERMAQHNFRLGLQQRDYSRYVRIFLVVLLSILMQVDLNIDFSEILRFANVQVFKIFTLLLILLLLWKPTLVRYIFGFKFLSLYRLMDYCYQGPEGVIDEKEKIQKYKPPKIEKCEPKLCAYPMMFHADIIPCMPRNCSHNYKAAVEHRVLNKTPKADWSGVELPEDLKNTMLAIRPSLIPLRLEEWLERFPASKRNKLREEIGDFMLTNYGKKLNNSKMFIKKEMYTSTKKAPRPIHSSEAWMNYSVGRWLVPLSQLLFDNLPETVMFPIHGDSEMIGQFFKDHCMLNKYALDYSKFDSTQCSDALLKVVETLRLSGIPETVLKMMCLDTESCTVYGKFGLKYVILSLIHI